MVIAQLLLAYTFQNWLSLCFLMLIYFIAFNILEAALPSLVSRQANPNSKGTAMGVYSTSQFLGLFIGGTISGVLYQWSGSKGIFITNTVLSALWLLVSFSMKSNASIATLILPCSWTRKKNNLINELLHVKGVIEVAFAEDERVIYLRVNREHYLEGSARKNIHSGNR